MGKTSKLKLTIDKGITTLSERTLSSCGLLHQCQLIQKKRVLMASNLPPVRASASPQSINLVTTKSVACLPFLSIVKSPITAVLIILLFKRLKGINFLLARLMCEIIIAIVRVHFKQASFPSTVYSDQNKTWE